MVGQKFLIHIKKGVKVVPLNVCTPRKMPIAYLEAAKKKKYSDLKRGVAMVLLMSFVPNSSGKVH